MGMYEIERDVDEAHESIWVPLMCSIMCQTTNYTSFAAQPNGDDEREK